MNTTNRVFQIWAANVPNSVDCGVPIAASRAGHTGLFDIEYADLGDPVTHRALHMLGRQARGSWARLRPAQAMALAETTDARLAEMPVAVLVPVPGADLSTAVMALREMSEAISVAVEVRDAEEARAAEAARADLLVAKGHEAGGTVGDETAFLLVQRLVAVSGLPVLAQGGVSLETAAALRVAGAVGVVLDWQLALTEESAVSGRLAATLARMDGSETYLLGADGARPIRIFSRTQRDVPQALQDLDRAGETLARLPAAVDAAVDLADPDGSVWLTGQDAAFAAGLARRFGRTGRVLDAIAAAVTSHPGEAARTAALAEGGPLAEVLGTRYPIVQGPMTRVSDRAEFALSVAEGGALPFLALALMRRDEADALVAETADMLGDRPWGVGFLGFVDEALRAEQMEVIAKRRPNFALIAGGRPEQALGLERDGIPTYLHVPSPGLLKLFLQSGARRFIFEGRECGGHVGPRSSAVLWQQAVDAILDHYGDARADDLEILFAGGLHDDVSAAMVSTLAAPLTAKGVKIGALIGTAYILTEEAVRAGAVLEGYQRLALEAKATRLLESGVGHATRVVESPIVQEFYAEKARMRAEQQDPEHIKDTLEHFNVGRSRIASKGMDRNPDYGKVEGAPKLVAVPEAEQIERGLYMIGQVASLHDRPMTIAALHADVCAGSQDLLAAFAPKGDVSAAPRTEEGPGARIAITGLGTILPGAADLSTYWENILDRVDAIQEVPERRWDWRRYYDADRNAPDKTYSRWGGFLDEIDFDPIRYGIPPNSMPSIEPLQLLALEVVRQALESAGFKDGQIPDPELRRRTCVIIGARGAVPLASAMPSVRPCRRSTAACRSLPKAACRNGPKTVSPASC
ncbi:MAG: beta-ketoacyl synthase N-terminal-like domain-containing protein [Paracoccaceae bacterium]